MAQKQSLKMRVCRCVEWLVRNSQEIAVGGNARAFIRSRTRCLLQNKMKVICAPCEP